MRNWFLALTAAAGLAMAGPATASQVNGFQYIVDFEDQPVGTGDFTFFADQFLLYTDILGGVVTAKSDDPTMHVYSGTAIGVKVKDPEDFDWPAIGAFVTGSAEISLTLYQYDYDTGMEVFAKKVSSGGNRTNFYLGADGDGFTSGLFESTSEFTIDDLKLGLPDVAPGIPEPSTWLLLLGGFGLTGVALRNGRARQPSIV